MSSKSDKANSLELLENLKNEALSLQYNDDNLDKVKKRAEMLVKNVFGQDSEYLGKLENIRCSPQWYGPAWIEVLIRIASTVEKSNY